MSKLFEFCRGFHQGFSEEYQDVREAVVYANCWNFDEADLVGLVEELKTNDPKLSCDKAQDAVSRVLGDFFPIRPGREAEDVSWLIDMICSFLKDIPKDYSDLMGRVELLERQNES